MPVSGDGGDWSLRPQARSRAGNRLQDEYRAASIFWVPKEARWQHLKASAPQPTIGTIVDDAMAAIERDNPSLKGVLPKDYGRPGLDKQRLGQFYTPSPVVRVLVEMLAPDKGRVAG